MGQSGRLGGQRISSGDFGSFKDKNESTCGLSLGILARRAKNSPSFFKKLLNCLLTGRSIRVELGEVKRKKFEKKIRYRANRDAVRKVEQSSQLMIGKIK